MKAKVRLPRLGVEFSRVWSSLVRFGRADAVEGGGAREGAVSYSEQVCKCVQPMFMRVPCVFYVCTKCVRPCFGGGLPDGPRPVPPPKPTADTGEGAHRGKYPYRCTKARKYYRL